MGVPIWVNLELWQSPFFGLSRLSLLSSFSPLNSVVQQRPHGPNLPYHKSRRYQGVLASLGEQLSDLTKTSPPRKGRRGEGGGLVVRGTKHERKVDTDRN